jgi:hypothetical protein
VAILAQEFAVAGKNLDAVIAGIGHVDIVVRVDAEALRAAEFAGLVAQFSPGAETFFAVRGEMLHALGIGVFANVKFAPRIDHRRARHAQLAHVGPFDAELRHQLALGRKKLTRE